MSPDEMERGKSVDERLSTLEKWVAVHTATCEGKFQMLSDHIKQNAKEHDHFNGHLDEFERSISKLYTSQVEIKSAVNTGKYVGGLIAGVVVGIVLLIGEAIIRSQLGGN